MRRVSTIAMLLVTLTIAGTTQAASAQSKRALIRMLQQQGFQGALSGVIHFTTIGTLHCPESNFRVIYFEWYGPAHPSSHRAQYRILFFKEGSRYVGSYVVMGGPVSIRKNSVLFTYDESSENVITCAASRPDETVPAENGGLFDVQLKDGGSLTLEK